MYWKITKDHLVDGTIITESRVGESFELSKVGEIFKVRLLDDDGEVYYEAEADDEGMESIFEFAYRDAGAVLLQVWENGKWVNELA